MKIFNKKAIGLDIADHTIEVVELTKEGTKINVTSTGRTQLAPGVVERGEIKNADRLTEVLKSLFENAQPQPIKPAGVIFGLPGSLVYTHVFSIGPHEKEKRLGLISEEAQSHIPLPSDDLIYSYQIISEKGDKAEIFLVAISRKAFVSWQDFFRTANIKIDAFDIEALAIYRGIFSKQVKLPVCIIDLGSVTTNINIFDEAGIRYSHTLNIGGDAMTAEVARALSVKDLNKAEKEKRKEGLTKPGEKVCNALVKVLEPIVMESNTAFSYLKSQTESSVKELILVGGSSLLSGLPEYFNVNLNIPARLGKPVIIISEDDGLLYLESIGLALRNLESRWNDQPTFSLGFSSTSRAEPLTSVVQDGKVRPPFKVQNWIKTYRKEIVLTALLLVITLILSVSFWYDKPIIYEQ